MGNSESTSANELRSHNVPLKLPMPDKAELDERFNKVLQSMNLPPDKMKVLSKYDASKKWQLVCDKDLVQVKHPPAYFVKTINSYLDHTLNGKKFRKRINHSTRVLRDLEISLRTNHIGWVREFLDGQHQGLDVLVNYLAFAQYALVCSSEDSNKHDLSMSVSAPSTLRRHKANSAGDLTMGGSWKNLTVKRDQRLTLKSSTQNARTLDRKLKHSRTIIDREDVHVCITCLRAIMNYQQGFTLVMAHKDCINQIVLSLKNRSFKTKSLVLELLAAVCLVQGGHDIILRAFDNFKIKCSEPRRFDSLMKCFEAETENIEFMVSCMQFINIVVHSVEDMNFRVHLQHEFTLLGLDDFLDRLRGTESDRLKVQIQAYLDNMFDVSTLLEDSESKHMAMERIERLEDQLLKKNEQNTWQEYENSCKIVQLEKQLSANIDELSQLKPSRLEPPGQFDHHRLSAVERWRTRFANNEDPNNGGADKRHKKVTRRSRASSATSLFTPEQRHSAPDDLLTLSSPSSNAATSCSSAPLSDIDRSFALDPEFSFLLSLPATFFDGGHNSPPSSPFSPYAVLPSIEAIDSATAQNSIRRSANFQAARARYEQNSTTSCNQPEEQQQHNPQQQQHQQQHMMTSSIDGKRQQQLAAAAAAVAASMGAAGGGGDMNTALLDTIWEDRQGALSSGSIPQQYITAESQLRLKQQLSGHPGAALACAAAGGGGGAAATLSVADLQAKGDQLSSSKDSKLPSLKLPPAMFDDDEDKGPGLSFKVKTKDATDISSSSIPSAPLSSGSSSIPVPPPPPLNIPPPPAIGVPPPPPLGGPRIPNLPPGSGLKQKKVYKPKYRLQNLNLTPMRPNQVAGTIFNDLDDDSVLNRVNMDQFEELFKTKAQDSEAGRQRLQRFNESRMKRGITIIDVNRARNLSILLRKIGLSTDEICQALYNYDLSRLSLEHVEMLPNFMPNDQELKMFKDYEKTGKSFDDLTPEDKFMWLFGRVERLQQRLTIMIFIGSFPETHVTLLPQIAGVIAASMSIKSSPNLKRVLEVVLAFGNYMNSSKRGAVYGFKLQSLDALADTKSADKKWTLLHYIVNVLDSYYPDAKSFYKELRYVDRACKVSFENILSDVASIKKGMHMTEKQCEVDNDKVLTQFINTNRSIVDKILQDTETAKEAYENVVKYFGETPKTMPPETFFPMVNRFIEAYKRAEREVEERKIAEAKLMEQNRLKDQNRDNKRRRDVEDIRADGERLVTEIRSKQRKDRRAIESKDGAIEDNINYIKSEPYRRSDTVHRSFRKLPRGDPGSRALTATQMSTML